MIYLDSSVALAQLLADARVEWSGVEVGRPDLGPDSRSLALTLHTAAGWLHVICNAWWGRLDFELPATGNGSDGWRRIIDTSIDIASDVVAHADAPPVAGDRYAVGPRSVVCLAARRTEA